MRNFSTHIVLVRTLYDSNIGASARAMSNMGAHNLILIDPQCEITLKAHQAAASGQKPLEQARRYSSLKQFYAQEPDGIRIALTARDGKGRLVRDLGEALTWIRNEHPEFTKEDDDSNLPIYLIFGPEDWGLSTEDIELAHFACCIPTYGENWSLNLGQAVLLALFILRGQWGGDRTKLDGQQKKRKEIQNPSVFPEQTLKTWLQEMGFEIRENSKVNVYRVLKRMLLQNIPNKKEIKILETVLQQSIRKLKEYNDLRKQMGLPHIESKD